jgi:hypothetical protein
VTDDADNYPLQSDEFTMEYKGQPGFVVLRYPQDFDLAREISFGRMTIALAQEIRSRAPARRKRRIVMTAPAICPDCGQRMLVRHGVRLSPKLADIFDMVEHAGDRGVNLEVLAWCFYPDKPQTTARNAVRVSINHINDYLEETDVRIRMRGRSSYHVVNLLQAPRYSLQLRGE